MTTTFMYGIIANLEEAASFILYSDPDTLVPETENNIKKYLELTKKEKYNLKNNKPQESIDKNTFSSLSESLNQLKREVFKQIEEIGGFLVNINGVNITFDFTYYVSGYNNSDDFVKDGYIIGYYLRDINNNTHVNPMMFHTFDDFIGDFIGDYSDINLDFFSQFTNKKPSLCVYMDYATIN